MYLHYAIYSSFRVGLHKQAFAASNRRNKSLPLNVFLPEVFRVCIITLLVSYPKRYMFYLNIYFLSESLENAERDYISYHKRHSGETPYPRVQEAYSVDRDCTRFTLSLGSGRSLFLW